jgi:long-chain acyl-CoA synthetase
MNDSPWVKNSDKGVPATIEYPPGPVFQFLENTAQKYPDHACTIFKGAVISYKEMNAITDRVAGGLVRWA